MTMVYDAFISYSHATDGKLAPALQRALKSLAKPWYRVHALAVFRDETDLSAVSDLTAAIRGALASSRFFVYLASPSAAKSRWVGEEIETWKHRNLPGSLLIALTEGEIAWNATTQDFDWDNSTALHSNLKGVFTQEPLWVDLRWAKSDRALSSRDPRFQRAVAMLAAPMHGMTLDKLIGEDVHQHRRTQWLIGVVIATLTLLLALFIGATVVASRINTNLQSKLNLVDTVLPFFRVESIDAEDDQDQISAWDRLRRAVHNSFLFPTKAEIWVERGPRRLALRSDCTNPRRDEIGSAFDCPKRDIDFDRDGLRSDIPGLAAMVGKLAQAMNDGRAAQLLMESRLRAEQLLIESSESDNASDDPELDARELQQLVDHADILLPDRLWKSLPSDLKDKVRPDHFEFVQNFEIWRRPIAQAAVDSELIVILLNHSGYCGSGGCSNPTLGYLRVGQDYALIFAQLLWGDIALYDAGPGNMPQIFSIGIRQSGVAEQYRTITRSIFDAKCVCYRQYLTGRITSIERYFDQRVPLNLVGVKGQPGSTQDLLVPK